MAEASSKWLGWRWIFWLDIPQSFILIALLAILPERGQSFKAKMDYLGATDVMGGALTFLSLPVCPREACFPCNLRLAVPFLMIGLGSAPGHSP